MLSDPIDFYDAGNALLAQGRLDEAADSYRKAIALKPDFAAACNNLGIVFYTQGRLPEATQAFRSALACAPDYAEAWQNLAGAAHSQGLLQDAVEAFDKAQALRPDDAELRNNAGIAHNNLGIALGRDGRLNDAIASYRRALALAPDQAFIHSNLGTALKEHGQIDAAIESYARAIELDRAPEFRTNFVECIKSHPFRQIDPRLRRLVVLAITEPWSWQSELVNLATRLMRLDPSVDEAVRRAQDAWPRRLTGRELCGPRGVALLVDDPLLRAVLENVSVEGLAMERFLSMVRSVVLDETDAASASREGADDETLAFCCAVARQCFINEYVFSCEAAEAGRAESLRVKLAAALERGDAVPARWIAAVAAYGPLSALPSATRLLDRAWPEPVAALLNQQIREPLEEQRLRREIPALTAIEEGVGAAVRRQYEENPYPRWIKLPPAGNPLPLDDFLRQQLRVAAFRPSGKGTDLDILIAGCGTGLEAVATAQRFPAARILAIDLSLSSLSYAHRKTNELGIGNIEYAQADIMKLGSLARRFDIVTSMGVLHHMADPAAGLRQLLPLLRPGGFLRLGLYSELARQAVIAAREFIAAGGYASNDDDIRRCRQELIRSMEGTGFQTITAFKDFYVTSECRDLLFHVQEQRFTLPQVEALLAGAGLRFLGFSPLAPDAIDAYAARFPGDDAWTRLDYWHFFETEFPDTFVGMYQFWCQLEG